MSVADTQSIERSQERLKILGILSLLSSLNIIDVVLEQVHVL